ncbi:MAG: alpha/beta hydrolase [Spirochaetales bacterium]|nr:alpha/beta hydrolase [Spirochaetales bacterium]
MLNKTVVIAGSLLLIIAALTFKIYWPLSIHGNKEEVSFINDNSKISASLYYPRKKESFSVVIFIHGDGASDRTSGGNYNIMMNAFLDRGIACFSYDKPGIGNSEGNWLTQTMKDRAIEVNSAITKLEKDKRITSIGLLGLSQGGWVLSELAQITTDYDYIILIGGAIDWISQGKYYTEQKLAKSMMTDSQKAEYRLQNKMIDQFIIDNDYSGYLEYLKSFKKTEYENNLISKGRFEFFHKNVNVNAKAGIYYIHSPFLGLFGEKDRNVDARESLTVYDTIFRETGNTKAELHLVKNANHSLLKSRYEDFSAKKMMWLEMLLAGKKIYADGVLETLGSWTLENSD